MRSILASAGPAFAAPTSMMIVFMLLTALPQRGSPVTPIEKLPADEVTSPLSQTLDILERDSIQAQNDNLSTSERTQLALEIRTQGERVRGLMTNQPAPLVKLG